MTLFDSRSSYYNYMRSGYESVERYIEWLCDGFPFCVHADDPKLLTIISEALQPNSYKEYGLANVPDNHLDQVIIFVTLMKYYNVPCTNPLPKNAAEVFHNILKDKVYFATLAEQIPEYCVLAMARFAREFHYVKEQTPELCLMAVESDPTNLNDVKDLTFDLCLAAVQADPNKSHIILRFIHDLDLRKKVSAVVGGAAQIQVF